jgi:hypothetical protein
MTSAKFGQGRGGAVRRLGAVLCPLLLAAAPSSHSASITTQNPRPMIAIPPAQLPPPSEPSAGQPSPAPATVPALPAQAPAPPAQAPTTQAPAQTAPATEAPAGPTPAAAAPAPQAPTLAPGEPGQTVPPPQPTMRALLPSSVQVLRDPDGTGIVMYGSLTARATSALAVLQGVFTYSQAFDPIPALPLTLADDADRHAQALFTATVGGKPVIGVAVAALSDKGGDVSVFYDYAGSFAVSFARLRRAFADSDGTGTIGLLPYKLGDGSQIAIPAGWRIIGQGAGLVDLMGTRGEFISLGVATPVYAGPTGLAGYVLQGQCCDPVAVLQAIYPQLSANAQHMGSPPQQISKIVEAQSTPAPGGGQAAFVLANLTVGNRVYSYFALVQAVAGFIDPWTLNLSGVTAPQPVFSDEFPTLLRIWQSHAADPQDFGNRLQQALRGMSTAQRMAQSITRPRETADYNAAGGWDDAIRAAANSKAPIDDATARKLAAKLTAETAHPWHIIPAAELK